MTDEASALLQARGVVEEGSLVVPETTPGFEFYGRRDVRGRPRAPYGPAHALAIAPFFQAGKLLVNAPGVPSQAADLVLSFAAVLSSAAFAALAVTLLFLLLESQGFAGGALAASLALALGTPLFAYSAYLFSEPLAAALLTGAAVAAFGKRMPISAKRGAVAGALLGACLLVRPSHALAVPVFGAAILFRERGRGARAALTLGAGAAVALAGYLLWNYHLYRDPLEFGYPGTADGVALNRFDTPLARGLSGLLLSPGKSILLFAPPVILGLAGLPALLRRDAGVGFLAGTLPLAYLIFYARFPHWEGGYCFGPRYLVPTLPFLVAGLAEVWERWPRRRRALAVVLVAAGALVQSVGLATSFLEDQRRGGYYDERLRYRMSHAPLASQGALLFRYLTEAAKGAPPAPLGKGFDRWFVFLHKAGVAKTSLAALLAVFVCGAAVSGSMLLGRAPTSSA